MRLIIIEDQVQVLKKIRELLTDLSDTIEIKMICCNNTEQLTDFSFREDGWYNASNEDELYEICERKLGLHSQDRYLFDITLFQESQMDKKFSDYVSVKLADYISKKDIKDLKIKFYTYPRGISPRDFANETKKWGKPIYRPKLDNDDYEEKEAQKIFIEDIKEYCNV